MARFENIVVTSLAQYIQDVALRDSTRFYTRTSNYMPIYRGQANSNWLLAPSVYRDNQYKHESNYIREIERIEPDSFKGLSYIEKVMKMQHYGLPTRLIDFTTNSLVALYFACCEQFENDGIVFELHAFPLYRQEFVWVSIVMKYIFEFCSLPFNPQTLIEEIKKDTVMYPTRGVEDLYNDEAILKILTSPIGIYPRFSNPRLKCQDGVFILFGMKVERVTRDGIEFGEASFSSISEFWPESRSIFIPAAHKKKILADLDKIGINERKLYPELESQIKYAVKYINKQDININYK